MSRTLLSLVAMLTRGAAMADVPRVAVDIAPVHSLVARVMEGVGTPDLILPPGASPHEYNLRPSEAGALQAADLVFWIGPDLTPWMADAIATLAGDAEVTALLGAGGSLELPFREGALFEGHGEDAGEDGDHGHDHGHDDDHGHDHGHDDDHGHGDHDPHVWLAPGNAAIWLDLIAGKLSAADPENAGTYFVNAAAGRDEIAALTDEIEGILAPVRGKRFIVFHDAYRYFEESFDFPASGAISLSDASDPSPARIAEILGRIAEQGIDCVLAEPQFNAALVATVMDGSAARTGVIDPLGSDLEPGPGLYGQLMRNMATVLAGCL